MLRQELRESLCDLVQQNLVIGFAKLLANSICGIGETRLLLYKKNES